MTPSMAIPSGYSGRKIPTRKHSTVSSFLLLPLLENSQGTKSSFLSLQLNELAFVPKPF
jgi:hypothetical protein